MENNRKKVLALSLLMTGAIFSAKISSMENPVENVSDAGSLVVNSAVDSAKTWEISKNVKHICGRASTLTKVLAKKAGRTVKSHRNKVLVGVISAAALTVSYFVWKKFKKNNDKKAVSAEQA